MTMPLIYANRIQNDLCPWCRYPSHDGVRCSECGLSRVNAQMKVSRRKLQRVILSAIAIILVSATLIAWYWKRNTAAIPNRVLMWLQPLTTDPIDRDEQLRPEWLRRKRLGLLDSASESRFVYRFIDQVLESGQLIKHREILPESCDPFIHIADLNEMFMIEGCRIKFLSVTERILGDLHVDRKHVGPRLFWMDPSIVLMPSEIANNVAEVRVIVTQEDSGSILYDSTHTLEFQQGGHDTLTTDAPLESIARVAVKHREDELFIALSRVGGLSVTLGVDIQAMQGDRVLGSRSVWMPLRSMSWVASQRANVNIKLHAYDVGGEPLRVVIRSNECIALRDVYAETYWVGEHSVWASEVGDP